jgi:molybdenum-dependent DNA-binding transcriptional regulator ModE
LITQRQAAEKMGVTDRWVRRLLARMAEVGDRVVVHGLRGGASNAGFRRSGARRRWKS